MKIMLAAMTALALTSGAAFAQTATDATGAPPVSASTTTQTTHAQDAYGNTKDSKSTVYQDSTGAVAKESQTTTIIPPTPPPATSTTTTTTTQSGTGQ
jgi:hypothetical protein